MPTPSSNAVFFRAGVLGAVLAATAAGGPALAEDVSYLTEIRVEADFDLVSIPSQRGGEVERVTKYLTPASPAAAIRETLFQNVGLHRLHIDFLSRVFPDLFPAMEVEEYLALVERRATRQYYAGDLSRLRSAAGDIFYGFAVFTNAADPAETLTADEVRSVYTAVSGVFSLRPLFYAPDGLSARAAARGWVDPGFPIHLGPSSAKTYQAYTLATGYGRVRILTAAEFDAANASGRIGWQDILVLDRAPSDIEGVVAGVITAEEQDDLSHVAVRTARRGTPNAFLAGALDVFRPLAGKLIRLDVAATRYEAREASAAEAEAWWAEHRPRLSEPPRVDREHAALDTLAEMDLSASPLPPEARFGGKAANFARLQRILTGPRERYREPGFGIPMRYYLEFLRANRTISAFDPIREVTYEEYIAEILADPRFQSDPEARFEALARFRDEVEENGVVDHALVDRLAARIEEVFGSPHVPVRFRSSSNVEDALEFNGAGLYDSTTGCAADDLDPDNDGPSLCDPGQSKERRVVRALKHVWASLWNFRAYEERAYYGIAPDDSAMAVLVTPVFSGERANGVAFTGNLSNPLDRRYVVVAQVGEVSVVTPEAGTRAEKDVLEVEAGAVVRIDRVRESSLARPGEPVVSDEKLRELGALLWHIDKNLPVDLAGRDRSEVLFDIEFKIEAGGDLAVKQVRPFLVGAAPEPGPTFELEVPAGAVACGAFVDGRDPLGEYAVKSRIRFAAGRYPLPTASPSFPGSLIEEVLFGPDQARAEPLAPGRFRIAEIILTGNGGATYRFQYEESFRLPGGETFKVDLLGLAFSVKPGEETAPAIVLDEELITRDLDMKGEPDGDPDRQVRYSSCSYEGLPRWGVHVELEGVAILELEERSVPPLQGSAPAGLAGASLAIGEATREVRDYWRLVYAAQRHNLEVRHLVVLEPPLEAPSLARPLGAIEIEEPQPRAGLPARASLLGPDLVVFDRPAVTCYRKAELGHKLRCGFRRGDADATGRVNITDAIFLAEHLFRRGRAPVCLDPADFDDDGDLDQTDVVAILLFLSHGIDRSAPPGPFTCGPDPTHDDLAGECDGAGCS
jgi:hypothetical protein